MLRQSHRPGMYLGQGCDLQQSFAKLEKADHLVAKTIDQLLRSDAKPCLKPTGSVPSAPSAIPAVGCNGLLGVASCCLA